MLSVVVAGREDDRPPLEALEVARMADRLGYGELWVGESGPTWDSFALAAAIVRETEQIALSIGPIPVSVRDPASIGRGAASVAVLAGGRSVGVALGISSVRVVETFHGRCRAAAASVLARSAEEVRRLITTGMTEPGEEIIRGAPFRRRLPPGGGPLSIAAFGDRAIAVAARYADRMLLDLIGPTRCAVSGNDSTGRALRPAGHPGWSPGSRSRSTRPTRRTTGSWPTSPAT
jgi:alkanesulfonate monooxygenase SsuD/methylene tetrahydromethanopterin reductase-like flavin-dependent oxidoreductase (luciferase family)